MFAMMSEQRLTGAGDTGHFEAHYRQPSSNQTRFNERVHTLKESQNRSRRTDPVDEYCRPPSDDFATMYTHTTAQNAKGSRAIHHEFSSAELGDSEQLEDLHTGNLHRQDVTRSDLDAVPPYTHSPYLAENRKQTSTSQRLTTSGRQFVYHETNQSKQDLRVLSSSELPMVLEQLTLAEKLQLKSDFARGRSGSGERAT